MPYVDLAGVAGYYEQHGDGEPVLLLHGGFCSIETMQPQLDALAPAYRVHAPERPGQGRSADRPGPITFQSMVDDTVTYLDAVGVESAHVVGFSDGAIVALLLALQHPARVRSIVPISANLSPDAFGPGAFDDEPEAVSEAEPAPEAAEPDAEEEAYARLSPDGPEHMAVVLEKLMAMWKVEPQIDPAHLAQLTVPTLVVAGDGDSIPTTHTVDIARAIPGAQLCIVPGAGHLVVRDKADHVNRVVLEFLASLASR